MYETHHHRRSALDEYLSSVDHAPHEEAEAQHFHAPSITSDLRTKVLQTVLPIVVAAIRQIAPSHTKAEMLKDLAFAHVVQKSKRVATRIPTPSPRSFGEVPLQQHRLTSSFRSIVRDRTSHLVCSASLFAAITTTFITTSAPSSWLGWQQSVGFIGAGLTLLHVLFPLFDLAVMLFYFVTCRRQCRFLASQIALVHQRKHDLQHQCNQVLRQIKAAAAAQRGYLLDDEWMPPIGRLEANENAPHLSCVFLRQTLHAIYMSIAHSNSSGHLPPLPLAHHEPQASRHPSLLLMALSHQHNATMQFLDQALAALSFDDDQSLAHVLREIALWVDRLQQATAVLDDATKQVDLTVDPPEVDQASRTSATTTIPSSSSCHHLQQQKMLGNTLKTAVAVLFAADSRVDDPETTRQCVARVGELLAAATATWTKWQAGVVTDGRHPQTPTDNPGPDDSDQVDDANQERPSMALDDTTEAFTQVFTALSTGQLGREAERHDEAMDTGMRMMQTFDHVVNELQDVLVRRPLPEERVQGHDHAPVGLPTTTKTSNEVDAAFALPKKVSSELHAALFKLQQMPVAEEEFQSFDDDESDDESF
ncbi:hypothetical protein, variant 1 [Aphanomyces astaci]|uniref:Myosin-binding domain-containing protein n=1 Tax=Aphanomyces astaci TaxID=112090 RepID=W4GZZ6_APHAT|nr:hypothetical protein, variant 1 [Aphanomyces astaci]ETV84488.1 hypothetical protein, variant 1 [Aphanomyces astaci]|eukprot:XP_009826180.1 hypothetical protein, variant 1 [Aphanomyces astaci]